MKRSEILDTAKEYVTKDRASQHQPKQFRQFH
jgi:hypothetical protein